MHLPNAFAWILRKTGREKPATFIYFARKKVAKLRPCM